MSVGISNNYANLQKNERKISFEGKINARKYIELTPGSPVSDAFVKEMAQGLESIDGRILKHVTKDGNFKMKLAQKTTDAFPALKGLPAPGYPKGYTVDSAPAMSMGEGLTGFFEKPINQEKPTPVSIVHEIGHELDNLFKKRFTGTEGFTEVYLKDIQNLPENMKRYSKKVENADSYINYVIQGSTSHNATARGKGEAFAELFAMLNGGSVQEDYSKGMDKLYKQVFSNTTAYVEKLLYLMGKR